MARRQELKATFPVKLPEEMLVASEKARFGAYDPLRSSIVLGRHRNMKLRENADAKEKRYVLDGLKVDRFEVMQFIVAMVSEGMSCVELCKAEGMPTLLELKHWKRWHKDFDTELRLAEEVRGERYGEQATQVAMDAGGDENAALVKLKHEALKTAAARLNSDFQEKKVIETKDTTENQTYDQLLERWRILVKQNPDIKTLADSIGITEAEVVSDDEV
jgi:hypothetical protein